MKKEKEDRSKVIIKELIARVNNTIGIYESDWIKCQRNPWDGPETCKSFEQFIEVRFNFEAFKIPELANASVDTEGRLFVCTELENPDEKKRKFSLAHVKVINVDEYPEMPEEVRKEILEVIEFLGGSEIVFNNVKQKIKFEVKL